MPVEYFKLQKFRPTTLVEFDARARASERGVTCVNTEVPRAIEILPLCVADAEIHPATRRLRRSSAGERRESTDDRSVILRGARRGSAARETVSPRGKLGQSALSGALESNAEE